MHILIFIITRITDYIIINKIEKIEHHLMKKWDFTVDYILIIFRKKD